MTNSHRASLGVQVGSTSTNGVLVTQVQRGNAATRTVHVTLGQYTG